MNFIRPHRWRTQPRGPLTADPSAVSQYGVIGLWSADGGILRSGLPHIPSIVPVDSGHTAQANERGAWGVANLSYTSRYELVLPAALKPTSALSILCMANVVGANGNIASISGYPDIFGVEHNRSNASPYRSLTIARTYNAQQSLTASGSTSTNKAVTVASVITYGRTDVFAATIRASDYIRLYQNGAEIGTATATDSGDVAYGAESYLNIGYAPNNLDDYSNCVVYMGAMFAQQLSAAAINQLSENPWQLFAPLRPILYTFGQAASGTEATAAAGVGAVAVAGRAPTLLTETIALPGLGAVAVAGRSPALAGERLVEPGLGAAAVSGLAPSLLTELLASPGLGSVALQGRQPDLTLEALLAPSTGAISADGQVPGLVGTTSDERTVTPAPADLTADGNTPEIVGAERTIEPGVGAVVASGQAPTASTGELAGRLIRRGRKRIRRTPEASLSAGPVITTRPELRPDPPAHFAVPLSALGGVDITQVEARVTRLEAQARQRVRRRREEEEIALILLRVA